MRELLQFVTYQCQQKRYICFPFRKFKCNDNIHSGHDEESIQKKHGKCITFGILENSCESSPSTQPLPEVQLCVFGNETPKFTVVPSTRLYSGYLNLSEVCCLFLDQKIRFYE